MSKNIPEFKILLPFVIFLLTAFNINAQEYKMKGNEVVFAQPVVFNNGIGTLTSENDLVLKVIKKYLDNNPQVSLLRVEAHVDNTGDAKASQKLAEKMAFSVSTALINLGIDCKRLIAVSFVTAIQPAKNKTADNKVANAGIIFVNAAVKGKLIDGKKADGGGKVTIDLCLL